LGQYYRQNRAQNPTSERVLGQDSGDKASNGRFNVQDDKSGMVAAGLKSECLTFQA